MSDFCEANDYSYIQIPSETFLEYEQSNLPFRVWLNHWAAKNGVSPNVDVAIVGPSIKTLESGRRKTALNQPTPDHCGDYLRGMFVMLRTPKAKPGKKAKQSLENLVNFIDDIENDPRTIARKNLFWKPHAKTGFRAHKSYWVTEAPPGSELEGFQILSEIKTEHEAQMDVDTLTRKFVNLDRCATNFLGAAVGSTSEADSKRMSSASAHTQARAETATEWGRLLYARVFTDADLNKLLDPKERAKYESVSHADIAERIKVDAARHFPNGTRKRYLAAVARAGVIAPAALNISDADAFTPQDI